MLRIDIQELRTGPVDRVVRFTEPARTWPDVDADFAGDVEVSIHAESAGSGSLHITGKLEAEVSLACRRCLDPVVDRAKAELDLLFRLAGADEGDTSTWTFDAESAEIDLMPALREELLLAIPEYPLCRSDCRGICAHCGSRLESEACPCEGEEGDPRWDALRALRSTRI